jgi:protection of telomeres protein 1
MSKSSSSIAQVTKQVMFDAIIDGQKFSLPLPFTNMSYRVIARVVDFMPSRLEEFARPLKKNSEYDILSGSEDSGSSDESEIEEDDSNAADREWEWQFHLKLQDASDTDDRKAVWVVVDNPAAQCLLSMDACDLENNPEQVEEVRQRLFILWGELEERKARLKPRNVKSKSTQPPPDSSDDEGRPVSGKKNTGEIANLPFSCCIRQYGVKVPEEDISKADAGGGKRWQQMFGLFGVRISG